MITPLYIDPGTGSMLFSIIIGAAATLYFLVRAAFLKLKGFAFGGKAVKGVKNKFVVYGEDKRYFSLFEPVLSEFESRKIPVSYLTSSEDDPVFGKNYEFVKPEFIGKGNKAFAKLNFLSADIVLATTPALNIFQWKRSKSVRHYSHILHCPGGPTGYRLFGIDYYDSILLTGEVEIPEIRELEELWGLPPKEIISVGCPYLDTYSEKLKSLSVEKYDKVCVLVSPSWGKFNLLNIYGEKLLDNLIKYGFKVIIRPHPQSKIVDRDMLDRLAKKYENTAGIEWDYNPDNIYSLAKADIMISDFSSIIADYAYLFDRPVLYTGENDYMIKCTDAYWQKEKALYLQEYSKIAIKIEESDIPQIGEIIKNAISDKSLSETRSKSKDMFWQHRGEAGKRTVDFMVKKVEEIEGIPSGQK
jgi:hypothetical protein